MKSGQNIWSVSSTTEFWKKIAPGERVLHIYDDEAPFIDSLASFVGTGINAGESAILILTPAHRLNLELKLRDHAVHLDTLSEDNRYIAREAAFALDRIMEGGQLDLSKFSSMMKSLLEEARGRDGRRVRIYDEMVVLLRQSGRYEEVHALEKIWSECSARENFTLLCAYPRSLFENTDPAEMAKIYLSHSKILRDNDKALTQVMFRDNEKTA